MRKYKILKQKLSKLNLPIKVINMRSHLLIIMLDKEDSLLSIVFKNTLYNLVYHRADKVDITITSTKFWESLEDSLINCVYFHQLFEEKYIGFFDDNYQWIKVKINQLNYIFQNFGIVRVIPHLLDNLKCFELRTINHISLKNFFDFVKLIVKNGLSDRLFLINQIEDFNSLIVTNKNYAYINEINYIEGSYFKFVIGDLENKALTYKDIYNILLKYKDKICPKYTYAKIIMVDSNDNLLNWGCRDVTENILTIEVSMQKPIEYIANSLNLNDKEMFMKNFNKYGGHINLRDWIKID